MEKTGGKMSGEMFLSKRKKKIWLAGWMDGWMAG